MFSDLLKIRAIGPKYWTFRSVIGILVYGESSDATKKRDTKFSRLERAIVNKQFGTVIRANGYRFVVIGWGEGLVRNMTHKSYCAWLDKLHTIYKNEGVFRKLARTRD